MYAMRIFERLTVVNVVVVLAVAVLFVLLSVADQPTISTLLFCGTGRDVRTGGDNPTTVVTTIMKYFAVATIN